MSFPFFTDVDMPHLAVMFGIPSTFPPPIPYVKQISEHH